MTTWLIDPALFKALASTRATSIRNWLEANHASVFLSAASLVEIAAAIAKTPATQIQRREAMRAWLDGLVSRYADRIHPVDPQIAMRAGEIIAELAGRSYSPPLPRCRPPRHGSDSWPRPAHAAGFDLRALDERSDCDAIGEQGPKHLVGQDTGSHQISRQWQLAELMGRPPADLNWATTGASLAPRSSRADAPRRTRRSFREDWNAGEEWSCAK